MSKNNNNGTGLTIIGTIQVVLIILKLLSLINWSWLIVLIPLEASIIGRAIGILIYYFCFL